MIKVLYQDQERSELRAFKGYSGDQKAATFSSWVERLCKENNTLAPVQQHPALFEEDAARERCQARKAALAAGRKALNEEKAQRQENHRTIETTMGYRPLPVAPVTSTASAENDALIANVTQENAPSSDMIGNAPAMTTARLTSVPPLDTLIQNRIQERQQKRVKFGVGDGKIKAADPTVSNSSNTFSVLAEMTQNLLTSVNHQRSIDTANRVSVTPFPAPLDNEFESLKKDVNELEYT